MGQYSETLIFCDDMDVFRNLLDFPHRLPIFELVELVDRGVKMDSVGLLYMFWTFKNTSL